MIAAMTEVACDNNKAKSCYDVSQAESLIVKDMSWSVGFFFENRMMNLNKCWYNTVTTFMTYNFLNQYMSLFSRIQLICNLAFSLRIDIQIHGTLNYLSFMMLNVSFLRF